MTVLTLCRPSTLRGRTARGALTVRRETWWTCRSLGYGSPSLSNCKSTRRQSRWVCRWRNCCVRSEVNRRISVPWWAQILKVLEFEVKRLLSHTFICLSSCKIIYLCSLGCVELLANALWFKHGCTIFFKCIMIIGGSLSLLVLFAVVLSRS